MRNYRTCPEHRVTGGHSVAETDNEPLQADKARDMLDHVDEDAVEEENGDETTYDILTRAYSRMTLSELEHIGRLRRLRIGGKKEDMVERIVHNEMRRPNRIGSVAIRKFSGSASGSPSSSSNSKLNTRRPELPKREGSRQECCTSPAASRLPPELLSEILEYTCDWELAQALEVKTRLRMPPDWYSGTRFDRVLLTGSLRRIRQFVSAEPTVKFTEVSGHHIVRFGYVHVLDYLFKHHRQNFLEIYEAESELANDIVMRMEIPWLGSRYGHTSVLDWWFKNSDPALNTGLTRKYDHMSLNIASQHGHIPVLEWWKASGLPITIHDVMDFATIGGQLHVLEWWLHSGYNTNLMERDALGAASASGKVEILEWFKNSGMQLNYEYDVLNLATKYNKPEVLQWWEDSGLRAEYIIADIQEAVEECHGDETRKWWEKRGIKFNSGRDVNPDEWSKVRILKPEQLGRMEDSCNWGEGVCRV